MDSPTRLPLLVSTHSPTFYYYSLTSIFCIAGKQCTCYCCLYYEDVLDAFLPILCRTPPLDQFQKNQGNEIVVYYLLFTGLLGYQPSHCYQPIFLELLLQLLLLLVTVLLLLLYYDRHHSYWRLQTLAIYMHLLHIYSPYSCWQGCYLYAFTAYLCLSQTLAVYMPLLAIYTFYSYWQFIHFTDTSCLYAYIFYRLWLNLLSFEKFHMRFYILYLFRV